MKSVTPALVTLLNAARAGTSPIADFDLYTFTLASSTVLRFTTADFDITDGTNLWSSQGVRVDQDSSKAQMHQKVGLDVDTWIVAVSPRQFDLISNAPFPDMIGGIPWLQAASGGVLDAADVIIDRAYFAGTPKWPMPPTGAVPVGIVGGVFAGTVGEVDISGPTATITINDYRSLLSTQMPYELFQGMCRYVLFSPGCTLNKATFAVNGTVIGGSTQSSITNTLGAPAGSATYTLGRIVMTSGNNNGFSRSISSWGGPATPFVLNDPLPFAIRSGDTFTAYPGCDKTQVACNKFGNILNFGGFPFIPAPEMAS